jgi:hypothetical protein
MILGFTLHLLSLRKVEAQVPPMPTAMEQLQIETAQTAEAVVVVPNICQEVPEAP